MLKLVNKLKYILGGLIVFSLIFIVFFSIHPVPNPSMEPAYTHGKQMLVLDLIWGRISKGDVILFERKDHEDRDNIFFKRVVGMPSDKFQVRRGDGKIIVDGKEVKDEWAGEVFPRYFKDDPEKIIDVEVGEGEYFLMGDNRYKSLDSRDYGNVKEDKVLGKVLLEIPFYY